MHGSTDFKVARFGYIEIEQNALGAGRDNPRIAAFTDEFEGNR